MYNVERCIEALKLLTNNWKYDDLVSDKVRAQEFILRPFCGTTRHSVAISPFGDLDPTGFSYRSTDADPKKKKMSDWRLWKQTGNGMVQWRTGLGKGEYWDNHRLIIVTHNGGEANIDRVPVSKFFKDPLEPQEGEMMVFLMTYPELAEELPLFIFGIEGLDRVIQERIVRQQRRK